jgi:hypothetical protein
MFDFDGYDECEDEYSDELDIESKSELFKEFLDFVTAYYYLDKKQLTWEIIEDAVTQISIESS